MNTKPGPLIALSSLCFLLAIGCSHDNAVVDSEAPVESKPQRIQASAHPTHGVGTNFGRISTRKTEPPAPSNPPAPPIKHLVKQMLAMDGEGKLDKCEIERIMDQMPEGGSVSGIGSVLCQLATSDNVDDRLDALTLLAAVRREWASESLEMSDETNDPNDEPAPSEAKDTEPQTDSQAKVDEEETTLDSIQELESSVVMNVLSICLADSDASVRSTALDTVLALPTEERNALSLQILGNDDASLQLALLSQANDPASESDITLNFHGLDANDSRVKQLATDNLAAMTGMSFKSSDAAFEWWENHNQSLEQ